MLAACIGISSATPPDIIRVDEEFFGVGDASFAVIRTVSDNRGSYYINRTTTFLVESSLDGGTPQNGMLLLDRETVVDAAHEGPGKPEVKVVIHSKNEEETLAEVIRKWPNRGSELAAEDLQRLVLHQEGLRYDGRLELPLSQALLEELKQEGDVVTEWQIKTGVEKDGTLFLKLFLQKEEGDSIGRWVSFGSGSMDQVNAFRNIHPVYLSFGACDTKEEAVRKMADVREQLKAKRLGSFDPIIWKSATDDGKGKFLVVVADSTHLIESGKIPEVEEELGIKLLPVASSAFTAWVPESD